MNEARYPEAPGEGKDKTGGARVVACTLDDYAGALVNTLCTSIPNSKDKDNHTVLENAPEAVKKPGPRDGKELPKPRKVHGNKKVPSACEPPTSDKSVLLPKSDHEVEETLPSAKFEK